MDFFSHPAAALPFIAGFISQITQASAETRAHAFDITETQA
ncbi:hypothetical protein RY831_27595 [Noviherbaspirillum sp. CPCC 100848]|uniref:Uncharacterized protein n=1 Tax=Noviherbaspirillum album TaxID=3080276 RepID=A0ABU6JHM8_9BURK|nr:hypothetical protein [Noviherbaspirillum sp. CPCC 100848]